MGAHVLDATLGTPGGAAMLVGPVVVQVESVTAMAPRLSSGSGGRCVIWGLGWGGVGQRWDGTPPLAPLAQRDRTWGASRTSLYTGERVGYVLLPLVAPAHPAHPHHVASLLPPPHPHTPIARSSSSPPVALPQLLSLVLTDGHVRLPAFTTHARVRRAAPIAACASCCLTV